MFNTFEGNGIFFKCECSHNEDDTSSSDDDHDLVV